MHHAVFLSGERGEGAGFDIPIITRALVAPFHRNQSFLEPIEWRGRAAERKRARVVFGALDLLGPGGCGCGGIRKGRRDLGTGEERAFAVHGGVELLRKGVVNDADKGLEFLGKGERDGHVGEGVDKVCGAVDGIDDEGRGGSETGGGRG